MENWIHLVKKAQKGDLEAFDTLVIKFRDMAVGYGYSLLKDFHLAEDAAQEAFIRAFSDLGKLKEPRAFPSWLRRIVFKFCDRVLRKKQLPTVTLQEVPLQSHNSPLPQEELEKAEREKMVLASVEALPEKERTVTTLFYIDGYSMAEVGSFLELPVSTVKSRLYTSRKHIKQRMVNMVKKTLQSHAQDQDFNTRIRKVLEQVPLIHFELHRQQAEGETPRCPESVPFPSCLRAFLEFTGRGYGSTDIEAHGKKWRLDNSYVMAMAACGAAFKLTWRPGWQMDNPLLSHIDDDPRAPRERALALLGIPYEILDNNGKNRQLFIDRIKLGIREKGRPLIAQGVVGPADEECLITGFDKDGEVLVGWSFFQQEADFQQDVEFEANGYFRKNNWYSGIRSLIIPGIRKKTHNPREVCTKALKWAVPVMQQPLVRGKIPNGIAAYQAWMDTIADEQNFRGKKNEELQYYYLVHHSNVGLLAECRWYAGLFLHRMQEQTAGDAKLEKAAHCFQAVHDLMWEIWGVAGGIGISPEKAACFADPQARRQITGLLNQAREKDRQALALIKAIL